MPLFYLNYLLIFNCLFIIINIWPLLKIAMVGITSDFLRTVYELFVSE